MANALTGDFDAVLQVGENVFRRLVAGLHRNDGDDPRIPTLPHEVTLPVDRDGLRGTLVAQVAVPVVSLIDGATDRVRLAIGVRGLFTPTADSPGAFLPPHINGTLHCEYRFVPLDPATPGWGGAAAEHLRAVVDPATVRFDGTTTTSLEKPFFDAVDAPARIRALLVDLLVHGMTTTPHRFGRAFRPDRLITLSRGGAAAAAVPVVGNGDPRSIERIFLGGSDVAVAISQEAVLAPVRRALADLQRSFREVLRVRVTTLWDIWELVDIAWGISITEATATWSGTGGGGGRVEVGLTISGLTSNAALNWAVHVTQAVQVRIDPAGRMSASVLGDPGVTVDYHGPYADRVRREVEQQAQGYIRPQVDALVRGAGADLGLRARADELAGQLRRLDPAATVTFDWSRGTADGVIVGGHVELSPQKPWRVRFAVDPGPLSGYTGRATWVPGGRIDSYSWSWSPTGGASVGPRRYEDRWVARPQAATGIMVSSPYDPTMDPGIEEMPGIGGVAGKVALVVTGMNIDDVSGELSPFTATSEPIDYTLAPHHTRVALTQGMTGHGGVVGGAELTHIIVTGLGDALGYGHGVGPFIGAGASTLVVRPGSLAASGLATMLGEGLTQATVEGAGLQLVVLAEAGRSTTWQDEAARALRSELGRLVPFAVYEDVDGSWARSLGMSEDADASWTALVSPQGGVPWADHGAVGGADLATALDTFLVPSGPPRIIPVTQAVRPGVVLSPWALAQGPSDDSPPPPIGRTGRRTVLTFVRPDAGLGHDALVDRVRPELAPSEEDTMVAVVVHGDEVGAVSRTNLAAEDPVIADPDGALARRMGVTIWPTTLLVDADGRVVRVLTTSWSPRSRPGLDTEEVAP